MYSHINRHAFFRANRADKARKLLAAIENVCGTTAVLETCEPYWKDEALFEVCFRTSLGEPDIADAVFAVLTTANKLAGRWEVSGPALTSQGVWTFSGIASTTQVTGIAWIAFRLDVGDDDAQP